MRHEPDLRERTISANEQRDAIHVAIVPLIAGDYLYSGQTFKLAFGSTEIALGTAGEYDDKNAVGIVNPFIQGQRSFEKGERFWGLLFPGTVTGMRHHWENPAFDNVIIVPEKIREFTGYSVGRDGSVWSYRKSAGPDNLRETPKRLEVGSNESGHLYVSLYKNDSKKHKRYVHRLVLEAFVGPCPDGMECCHRDGNPQNNALSNLYWGTKSQNEADKARHGTSNHGERNGNAKITEEVAESIRLQYASGKTQPQLEAETGIDQGQISRIVNNKAWVKYQHNEHELWLRQFCDEWNFDFDELIEAGTREEGLDEDGFSNRYVVARGRDLHCASELGSDLVLFWEHLEGYTGKTFGDDHREAMGWSCSC